MTFFIEGRSKHELMPLERLFDKRLVNKAGQVNSLHTVDQKEWHERNKNQHHLDMVRRSYLQVTNTIDEIKVVRAEQIMTSPVETVVLGSALNEVTKTFQKNKFRHMPVVSSKGKLLGMVSDRDVLEALNKLCNTGEFNLSQVQEKIKVDDIMINEVLTATKKTDVRYIVLLFIQNRIGSIPIIHDGVLSGIVTRSDVLRSVVSHYEIELWA